MGVGSIQAIRFANMHSLTFLKRIYQGGVSLLLLTEGRYNSKNRAPSFDTPIIAIIAGSLKTGRAKYCRQVVIDNLVQGCRPK